MRIAILFPLFLVLTVQPALSQPPKSEKLTVFLDCEFCDINFIKQEISQINYTLDPLRAQIHVLVSVNRLGSGGRLYLFDFIGREKFEGDRFTIDMLVDPQNTSLERSEKMVKTLTAGLVVFMAQNGESEKIKIALPAPPAASTSSPDQDDESGEKQQSRLDLFFDQWIYEVFSNLNWDKETNRSTLDFRYGGNMNYITDQWRIRFNPNFFYSERFVRGEEEDIRFSRRNNHISSAMIKSLTDHWSVGLFYSWSQNTYANIKESHWITPAVEYSIFPYSEAVTKEFTIAYRLGWTNQSYLEETIFLKNSERLLRQSLEIRLDMRQRWGNVEVGLTGANFFQDFNKNRLNFNADISVRVIKGLSFSLGGNYDVVNDQISLPRGDATLEEILLGQRQLATDFQTGINFGLRYTFGALFNNVVNTRL